jgi:acetyl esterase/lipase
MPRRRLPSLLVLALVSALAVAPAAASEPAADGGPCVDAVDRAAPYVVEVEGAPATGVVAFPAADPEALVVFAHGYGHTSASWVDHARRTAEQLGAVAVAMDYRGTTTEGGVRGWRVREGAADLVAAARDLDGRCGGFEDIVLFGVSMGGNASGLAVAAGATRLDGRTPLFDWWFDLEGAVNVVETYQGARALAPANAFARNAQADIEAEMGGTFEQVPDVYLDSTVVNRVDDIAASGVRGVFVTHAIEDGLVPVDQSAELVALLTRAGVPTEFVVHTTRDDGEAGTTISGYAVQGTPFAGHASETSTTHVVMRAGFDRLERLLAEGEELCDRRSVEFLTGGVTASC